MLFLFIFFLPPYSIYSYCQSSVTCKWTLSLPVTQRCACWMREGARPGVFTASRCALINHWEESASQGHFKRRGIFINFCGCLCLVMNKSIIHLFLIILIRHTDLIDEHFIFSSLFWKEKHIPVTTYWWNTQYGDSVFSNKDSSWFYAFRNIAQINRPVL